VTVRFAAEWPYSWRYPGIVAGSLRCDPPRARIDPDTYGRCPRRDSSCPSPSTHSHEVHHCRFLAAADGGCGSRLTTRSPRRGSSTSPSSRRTPRSPGCPGSRTAARHLDHSPPSGSHECGVSRWFGAASFVMVVATEVVRRPLAGRRRRSDSRCCASYPDSRSARGLGRYDRWLRGRPKPCPYWAPANVRLIPVAGRNSTDLQRDSRVADVVVRPASPTNPQEHRTGEHEQRSHQTERLGVQPAISHKPTLGRRIHFVYCTARCPSCSAVVL
jgi:hypothetical protein